MIDAAATIAKSASAVVVAMRGREAVAAPLPPTAALGIDDDGQVTKEAALAVQSKTAESTAAAMQAAQHSFFGGAGPPRTSPRAVKLHGPLRPEGSYSI